ncbi:hypothetical protein [Derxia gummosa]|uniref:Uncharacterized protein n=1 Tax=Derxia gummosa DSM 723 TaxID=1121388 RepID=A0A8B6XCU9_9BURK|nr:hypothetical protein [Derxia gummosa]
MPVWPTQTVDEQPMLHVRSWRIAATKHGTQHVVGYCVENLEGRVSSAIERFDADTGTAFTTSGRRYRLLDSPGWNWDADYVWRRWLASQDATENESESEAVTSRTWLAVQTAVSKSKGA